jgi:biotin carboxyl carrier protein
MNRNNRGIMTKKESQEYGYLNINSSLYKTRLSKKFIARKHYTPADNGMICSFIPGTVIEIMVEKGQKVMKGDDLMILDAMKMQNRLKASNDGVVKSIKVKKGDRVSKGTVLLEIR